jgi:hypothetical protein
VSRSDTASARGGSNSDTASARGGRKGKAGSDAPSIKEGAGGGQKKSRAAEKSGIPASPRGDGDCT